MTVSALECAVPASEWRVAPRFVERVPIHFARRHLLIGLATERPDVVTIATDAIGKQSIVDNLALTLDCGTQLMIASADAIRQAIDIAYQQQSPDLAGVVQSIDRPENVDVQLLKNDGDLLDNAARAPVIKLVNLLLFDAAQRRASDVHVQPAEDGVSIRLRIDGVLFEYLRVGRGLLDELVSRIKIMGGMDIAEKRLPQDGRSTVRIGQRLIDLRISIIPTTHGERVVLRLLDKGARLFQLAELGMAPELLSVFEEMIQRAHGLILMTGPTGSGKSTTLYAALQRLDYTRLNVVTLEDPIEYHLTGISQTQVSDRKGMTFATGLRSVLRQDPDVIMVGEIRDEATARLAVQSALTGHLVLSTLHTNDATGAVARLLDLGIEPYLVADALLAVGAQRLVRLNCTECRQAGPLDERDAQRLAVNPDEFGGVERGVGCAHCNQTGYYERQAIFELLVPNDELRERIQHRARVSDMRTAALQSGLRTLRQDGLRKIRAGQTTPAEVLRVVPSE